MPNHRPIHRHYCGGCCNHVHVHVCTMFSGTINTHVKGEEGKRPLKAYGQLQYKVQLHCLGSTGRSLQPNLYTVHISTVYDIV